MPRTAVCLVFAAMPGIDELVYHLRPAHGEPEGALVLLHGRGTSEYDLAPLLDELDPRGRLVGITPRGPLSLPPGGAHWYVVRQIGYPDPDTFFPVLEKLSSWFDALPELTGVPVERTVLGGVSQGTVMSYAVGLGEGRPRPAGLARGRRAGTCHTTGGRRPAGAHPRYLGALRGRGEAAPRGDLSHRGNKFVM